MGFGKAGEVAYLRGTPGLTELKEVGTGPIRLVHVDSAGRVLVVSYNEIYYMTESGGTWTATLVGADGLDHRTRSRRLNELSRNRHRQFNRFCRWHH